jgi:flavin reductase (DIM6/NTAB) family NADH-FMN oxidoreductase RutF
MTDYIAPVPLEKAYRLLNHGPTVLVSACHGDEQDVMAAAWACALDFSPPRLTVVLDKSTRTRALIEQAGTFVIQVPSAAQVQLTYDVGNRSLADDPHKLAHCGVSLVPFDGQNQPFVEGCCAWLACELIPEPHIQQAYDLFVAQVTGAWADRRVFKEGHWMFEDADPQLRSIHYVAGGQFYAIGESLVARHTPEG